MLVKVGQLEHSSCYIGQIYLVYKLNFDENAYQMHTVYPWFITTDVFGITLSLLHSNKGKDKMVQF